MVIIGISPLDKDATACLWQDSTSHSQLTALAEERLSRIKLHRGFPTRAVKQLLEHADLEPSAVDTVVYPFRAWQVEATRMLAGYVRDLPFTLRNGVPWKSRRRHLAAYSHWCYRAIKEHRHYQQELEQNLRQLGLLNRLVRVEHHSSHAASAFFSSGFDKALTLTLDWYGGGLAGSIGQASAAGITTLCELPYPHSLGLFYAQVTSALGYRASRHEGKIVGLAAYGDPSVLTPEMLERFQLRDGVLRYRSGMDSEFFNRLAQDWPPEQVAAAAQNVLEILVTEMAEYWLRRTGLADVALAGGVAANVKMNQRIAQIPGVRRIFVHPAMGDGGTCVGALQHYLFQQGKAKSREWASCYLGPDYSTAAMRSALKTADLDFVECEDSAEDIARLLARGKVVARFHGGVEYGPRALGHRSILCQATDPGINDWLNGRLGRTEFMPFAPITLVEHSTERYLQLERVHAATRFMTVTCDCTDLMQRESPAAVHVDGTSRPQLVSRQDSPDLHAILSAYHRLTGIPTLINTSFNMHEEPIVCTPDDAVRAFLEGGLDALAIGPFLALNPSQGSAQSIDRDATTPATHYATDKLA